MANRRAKIVSRRAVLVSGGTLIATVVATNIDGASDEQPLLVDDFHNPADRDDDAPAFERAFAAALKEHRNLQLTPQKTYSLRSVVPVRNDDGWTPILFGNGALIDIRAEASGFRYRGIKSGEAVNPSEGGIRNLTIDANHIAVSNGVWAIAVENGGGLLFDSIRGVNFRQGYGILNFRFADGGVPVGKFTVRNCRFVGSVLASTSDRKWYGFSDTGDLSSVMPGEQVPAGAARAIATASSGNNGVGMPRFANVFQWKNPTDSRITVPSSLTEEALASAGLNKNTEPPRLNGAAVTPVLYDYYSSAGTVLPDCVVQASGGELENFECHGAYYPVYLSGVASYDIRKYRSDQAIRGLAGEWGAKRVSVDDIRVRESLSSAWLFGYNCPDCSVDNFQVEELTNRWVGEALANVQLSAPRFRLGRGSMVTRNNVTNGQYFIKASVDCSDFVVDGPVYLQGDCAKAYICIESAYNSSISASNPEHYAQSEFYNGGASKDMTGIRLRNIEIEVDTVKTIAPTALCLMQVEDAVNGEIGLSDILIENVRAPSTKHVQHLKLYEGIQADKQINGVRMRNVQVSEGAASATTAARMTLPRKRAHFTEVRNVTGLNDIH